MRVTCEGTYIEHDGPATFTQDDKISIEVDYPGDGTVFVHLTGSHGHVGTITMSARDAKGLARELKRAATATMSPPPPNPSRTERN